MKEQDGGDRINLNQRKYNMPNKQQAEEIVTAFIVVLLIIFLYSPIKHYLVKWSNYWIDKSYDCYEINDNTIKNKEINYLKIICNN